VKVHIKGNGDLFVKWRVLGSRIMGLCSAVQNDMDVSEMRVKEWIEMTGLLGEEYRLLVEATLHHLNWANET